MGVGSVQPEPRQLPAFDGDGLASPFPHPGEPPPMPPIEPPEPVVPPPGEPPPMPPLEPPEPVVPPPGEPPPMPPLPPLDHPEFVIPPALTSRPSQPSSATQRGVAPLPGTKSTTRAPGLWPNEDAVAPG